ncbi:hypothetical protein [Streptomyces pakalii]|uniref:NAD(+)--protein-arginine ADP-ribosyltransferase n=1 Tax=Streptomyces pakalii TaxID=3036494 RepID=A0ABT7DAC3_9ACTN|nr:hypothetical protein [Streptomyces pakalii]MDJ1642761.1 hypothetical protein [Streptomyces pakalii]
MENHGGLLLLRLPTDDILHPADVADLARTLCADEDGTVTIVAVAAAGAAGALWPRLSETLDSLRDDGASAVRLVMSDAGTGHPDRPALGQQIADAWKMTVEAPAGPVLVVPGGSVFVPPGRGGWRRFVPDGEPEELGPRAPAPGWQAALRRAPARTAEGCVVDQIPAGVVIRPAGANAPRPGDLFHAIPMDPGHPAVVVGVPWGEDVVATDVAEVLAGLPAVVRRGVRLAPGGRRDLLPLGQSVAGLLDAEVEVTTGLPLIATGQLLGRFGIRSVLAGPDGEPRWLPFVDAVVCVPSREPAPEAGAPEPGGPAPAPRLLRWSAPAPELGLSENGVARLSDAWQAVATRAGLWVGPSGTDAPRTARPVSVDGPVVEIGRGGDRLDASLWPLLSRLLGRLAPDIRSRTTLHVHALTPDGGRALRGLAAEHALRMISFAAAPAPRPARRTPAPAGTEAGARTGAGSPVRAPVPSAAPASPESAEAEARAGAVKPVLAPVPSPLPTATERADLAGHPAPPVTKSPETTSTSASTAAARQASAPGSPDRTPLPESAPPATASSSTPPVAPEPSEASATEASATAASGSMAEASASSAPDVPPTPAQPPVPTPASSARPAGLSSAPLAPDFSGSEEERAGGTGITTQTPQPRRAVTESVAPRTAAPPAQVPEAPRARPVPTGVPSERPAPPVPEPVGGTAPARPDPAPRTRAAAPAPVGSVAADADRPATRTESAAESAAPRRLLAPVPVEPQHSSTPAERTEFRRLAESAWERHSAAVNRALAEMPALRGAEQETARTDLVALRLYLDDVEGPLDHRELTASLHSGERRLVPYAGCIASALARLPSYRGVVLRGLGGVTELGGLRPGDVVRDAAPVSGLPLDPAGKQRVAGAGFAIWSTTGRRVRRLLDGGDQVVFAPGTAYRVLAVRTDGADPLITLRQIRSPETASVLLEDADETALERLNHALSGRTAPGPGDWPDRCAGPLGGIGVL